MPDTNAAFVARADANLMFVGPKPPVVMERVAGMELFDVEGRRYLDFVGGWAVDCLGHSPRAVVEALAAQAHRLVNASPSFWNRPQIELAERLIAASGMGKVWFGSTGAEANEGAIKLAREWGSLRRRGARRDHHGRELVPRPHPRDDGGDRQGAVEDAVPAARPGLRPRPLRRPACRARRDHGPDRGGHDRARPGRGRSDPGDAGVRARPARALRREGDPAPSTRSRPGTAGSDRCSGSSGTASRPTS